MGTDLEKWIKAGMPPALMIDKWHVSHVPMAPTRGISPIAPSMAYVKALPDLPPTVSELLGLLKKNPGVKIINTEKRYTVLRDGKYVGGRINELVFRTPAVTEYILNHPAEEINGENFLTSINGEDAC